MAAMSRRPRRYILTYLLAASLIFMVLGGATFGWATSRSGDPYGLRFGSPDEDLVASEQPHRSSATASAEPDTPDDSAGVPGSGVLGSGWSEPDAPGSGLPTGRTTEGPSLSPPSTGLVGAGQGPGGGRVVDVQDGDCSTGSRLVPSCGVLWGVAPGALTEHRGAPALRDFEATTGRHQDIYHAYHRGQEQLFPTSEEIAIARQPGRSRILFVNWRPTGASWAKIAKGDPKVDAFLDRLAAHLKRDFRERVFLTVQHEPESAVRAKAGSGYTAADYAAMYRHVVKRLRAHGAGNVVSVLVHRADGGPTTAKLLDALYPGDDVVDWIGLDTYLPGDQAAGGLAALVDRPGKGWPGFYHWSAARHPDKPLMIAEWGLWSAGDSAGGDSAAGDSAGGEKLRADAFRRVAGQIARFPRIRAMVYFDTPRDQHGRDSRVDASADSLRAYRELGAGASFRVRVSNGGT